jgi:hypothetical protein
VTTTFTSTGSEEQCTVHAGVTSIHVVAIGERGGDGGIQPGGYGARLTDDVPITPLRVNRGVPPPVERPLPHLQHGGQAARWSS